MKGNCMKFGSAGIDAIDKNFFLLAWFNWYFRTNLLYLVYLYNSNVSATVSIPFLW